MAGGLFALLDDVAAMARIAAASRRRHRCRRRSRQRQGGRRGGRRHRRHAAVPPRLGGRARAADHQEDRDRLAAQQAALHPARGGAAGAVPALAAARHPDLRRWLPRLRGRPQGAGSSSAATTPRPTRALADRASSPRSTRSATVAGAIRTDFILSAEIMVIALKEVVELRSRREHLDARHRPRRGRAPDHRRWSTAWWPLIVKMDDVGLHLATRTPRSPAGRRTALVGAMPKLLDRHLGDRHPRHAVGRWPHLPDQPLRDRRHRRTARGHGPRRRPARAVRPDPPLEEEVHDALGGALGSLAGWLVNTLLSALVGLVVGGLVVAVLHAFVQSRWAGRPTRRRHGADRAHRGRRGFSESVSPVLRF